MFSWLSFLSYAIVTAITPGPNNIMSMSNAARLGFRKSFPFNLGVLTGLSIILLLCTLFCNTLSAVMPKIELPIKIIGALYMLWLAWKIFRSPAVIEENHSHSGFFPGLLLQFVNPKIYLYALVSIEAYIVPFYQGQWTALALFALLLAVMAFIATLCWAVFGSVFRMLFSGYARITNTVMALLLVGCAVSLFW